MGTRTSHLQAEKPTRSARWKMELHICGKSMDVVHGKTGWGQPVWKLARECTRQATGSPLSHFGRLLRVILVACCESFWQAIENHSSSMLSHSGSLLNHFGRLLSHFGRPWWACFTKDLLNNYGDDDLEVYLALGKMSHERTNFNFKGLRNGHSWSIYEVYRDFLTVPYQLKVNIRLKNIKTATVYQMQLYSTDRSNNPRWQTAEACRKQNCRHRLIPSEWKEENIEPSTASVQLQIYPMNIINAVKNSEQSSELTFLYG